MEVQLPHATNQVMQLSRLIIIPPSTGDHKEIFYAICLFLEDQRRGIRQDIVQQKMKPRDVVKIQLFQDAIGFVHPFALLEILEEKRKPPKKLTNPLPQACIYSIEQSMRFPCFYEIRARKRSPGEIAPAHIGAHWYYQHSGEQPQLERRILLEPSIVKGKGRPKGSKNKLQQKVKSYGVSSTRRDPSLYVCEALF